MAGRLEYPSQPNLDVLGGTAKGSLRFWLLTAATGAAAGIAGGMLMRLLYAVEHIAWRYTTGTLLEAASRDRASRHVLNLLVAAVLVGFGGALMRKMPGRPEAAETAIWFHSGRVPFLSTLVQGVHSIVAVGLGTSLGRESPIKQAGAAIASLIGRGAGVCRAEQRLLVACGVGAGMAAAYNVPVGGALFAVEVLLGSLSLRLALPALLCSGVATVCSWALLPTGPIYRVPEYPLSVQLTVWALAAGPLLGLATVPLVRLIGWADAHRPRRAVFRVVVPLIVITSLGVVSIRFPQLLGNGKDAEQLAFSDELGLWLLLVLPGLKLLATAACLGSGASGGLFTPTMTVGALLGGLMGHAWNHLWPGASMGSCAVIGSCAFLAAASQGPISALVLMLELTRHVDATMVPMLLAVAGAILVARHIESQSIYSIRLHLGDAEDSPAQTPGSAPATPIDRLMTPSYSTISAATAYTQVLEDVLSGKIKLPVHVLDHKGKWVGTIDRRSLAAPSLGVMPIEAANAADIASMAEPLNSQMTEQDVVGHFQESRQDELAVLNVATGRMLGVVANHATTVAPKANEDLLTDCENR